MLIIYHPLFRYGSLLIMLFTLIWLAVLSKLFYSRLEAAQQQDVNWYPEPTFELLVLKI